MTYFHLGPYAEDLTHYAGIPAQLPVPAAWFANLPSMTDDPTQDELG
jgi:hypothetical protein